MRNKSLLPMHHPSDILNALKKVSKISRQIVQLSDLQIAGILNEVADLSLERQDHILSENQKDLDRMDPENPKYDRLLLNAERLMAIATDLRKVARLPSPLHQTLESRQLPNGLKVSRISVPLGVVGVIFESRPNVTFDVFALCLRSGNACVLKGSRDAQYSNRAIVEIIKEVLRKYDLEDIVYLAPGERKWLAHILSADQYIDIIIPRGGQGLIKFVRENAKVPVIETGAGIVHTYFDKSGDIEKGRKIVVNAKSRRVSVCNALDTLIIHQDRLSDLPAMVEELGRDHQCLLHADPAAYAILKDHYPSDLLKVATSESFGTEFLSMQISVKTVESLEEAIDHIASYSSKHSESIIAESSSAIEYFLQNVDAAVVYANASTAFTDGGQLGLGAEIGISTQKLHARGPMALRELTSYKWIVRGEGQIRG